MHLNKTLLYLQHLTRKTMNAQAKNVALAARIFDRLPAGSPVMSPGAITEQARTLRRAQLTLHRWAEEMCNGTIQRSGPNGDGQAFRHYDRMWNDTPEKELRYSIPDRERGALARVAKVCKDAGLYWYYQRDPRGCALYVGAEPLTHDNYNTKGVPCL